jgi:hypothetical protein
MKKKPEEKLTIVQNRGSYDDYPFEAMDFDVLEELRRAYKGPASVRLCVGSLKHFECVLQLVGIRLAGKGSLASADFWTACVAFLGALNSSKFIDATRIWRHTQSVAFVKAIENLRDQGFMVPYMSVESSTTGPNETIQNYVEYFEGIPLDEEKVWLWTGWSVANAKRKVVNFPFFNIYKRLGRDFTTRLYEECRAWTIAKDSHAPLLRPLSEFIGSCPGSLSPALLQDSDFTTKFWQDFFVYYTSSRYEQGNQLPTILNAWNNHTLTFIRVCLESRGLFASPSGGMPAAPSRTKRGAATRIVKRSDGIEVKTRLITDIPLQFSDEEAVQILFGEIQRDIDHIEAWATAHYLKLRLAIEGREELAKSGQPRDIQSLGCNANGYKHLVSPHNPNRHANAAATFVKFGYETQQDVDIRLRYPPPLSETSLRLGLPPSDALLPLLTLLVIDHPILTNSFLENCELFDRSGRRVGLDVTDAGTYLVGQKGRKGPRLAQQEVLLTQRSVEVMQCLLASTQPLRDYLKARGDDNWRYLLLTAGKSFAYPLPLRNISAKTITAPQVAKLAREIGEANGVNLETSQNLAKRFSLSSLRASVAVRIYIRTGSVDEMAKALGHTEYKASLIEHYLPAPILLFFKERWIRIFQNGLVIEALKDSPYLLQATGFQTLKEVDEFLKHHAFKSLEQTEGKAPAEIDTINEIVFGVSRGVLAVLIALSDAVVRAKGAVRAEANYWASIAVRLLGFIESEKSGREDLRAMLLEARSQLPTYSFDKLVSDHHA